MQLSIVIPVYNPAHLESKIEEFLVPQLEAFRRNSDLTGLEFIYVCNGCTEKTREALSSYSEGMPVKVLWFDEGLGFTKATNEGIKASKGDIVAMWNDDAILLDYLDSQKPGQPTKDTWKKILLKPLIEDEKVGMTGVHELWCENSQAWFFVGFCVALRRSMLESIGLLDEIFSPGSGEDIDIAIRARQYGWKTVNVDPTKFNMRYKGTSLQTGEFTYPIYHPGESTFHNWESKNDFNPESKWSKVFNRNGEILKNRRISGYYSKTGQLAHTIPRIEPLKKSIYDLFNA
jgi:GT2 family glycosyltransferase|tara:strand:+ start:16164 stop:17030 length:867 start_codon:yes stop_codon:yes gene_type:complete